VRIEDDFLSQEDLDKLDSIISSYHFPWFFQKNQTWDDDPFFCHVMYCLDMAESQFYPQVSEIFKKHLNWTSMYRLNVNLVPKIGSTSNFHTDVNEEHNEEVMTTAIFYLNTNNGYTEFESGERVESISNRLLEFPSSCRHRATGQTDTDKRIVLNFNYIK
jgi:hypothetical protein|tara:strand:- start:3794 stop:4276 length:483 start_codon:yes stop_codon:yes gene_type:complete